MLPPQAIFDDLVFDVPSWGEARIGNEEVGMWGELRPSRFVARPTPERRSLFDDAQDTFFGDARSLFAPKIVTPPPSPPEARAKLVHTVSWDGLDEAGKSLSSGVYLLRLKALSRVETRKMTLMN